MAVNDLSTAELRCAARAVLRAYLDWQAGGAPSTALVRYLTQQAAEALGDHVPGNASGRSLTHAAVGPVMLLQLEPDRAYACAAVLEPRGGQSVVSLELIAEGGSLRVARVGRLAESGQRSQAEVEPPAVGDSQRAPDPPSHLAGLLGGLPDDPQARVSWLTGAAVIDTYRERYGIDDPRSAFGPQPTDPEQQAARERAVAYTRDLVAEIDRIEPSRSVASPARDQPRGPELGR